MAATHASPTPGDRGCLMRCHPAHNAQLGNDIWTSRVKGAPGLLRGLEGGGCWTSMAMCAQGPTDTDRSEWAELGIWE